VDLLDHVLMGFLSFVATAVSTFFTRLTSQKGPFLDERVMLVSLID